MSIEKQILLMLGDSLVEWGDWAELLTGYRILNRGMAGETVEGLAGRIFAEIDQHDDCGSILIMSGTNNLLMGDTQFPALFATMLPRLRLLAPDTTIIVNALLPMPAARPEKITKINQTLAATCEQAQCVFMDAGPEFATFCRPIIHPCFHPDGVHLTSHGYQTWAKVISGYLHHSARPDEG